MSEQMKKRFTISILAWSLTSAAWGQTTFQNFSVLDDPPPIDAQLVENFGTINLSASFSVAYDTQNTLRFINHPTGVMQDSSFFGSGGFRFDHLPTTNFVRQASELFSNSGVIRTGGRIDVWSNEIRLNDLGLLSTGKRGAVSLLGNDISLFNGRIRAGEGSDSTFFLIEGGLFSRTGRHESPLNVREDGWGVTRTNTPLLFIDSLAFSPGQSPFHDIQFSPGIPAIGDLFSGHSVNAFSPNFYLHSDFNFPNGMGPVSSTVNLVFVETNVADMATLNVGFDFETNSTTFDVYSSIIEFSITDEDIITGAPFTRSLTLVDEGAEVARVAAMLSPHFLTENIDRNGRFRPRAHLLEKSSGFFSSFFFTPQPPEDYDSDIVFTFRGNQNARYTTNRVSHEYSTSVFTVNPWDFSDGGFGGQSQLNPGAVPKLQDITNAPGRVNIEATNLDLTLARIRSENLLSIKADTLTGTQDMQLDAPNISLELLSSTGSTTLSNFFPSVVNRLHGQIDVWTGVWLVSQNITNQAPATFDPLRNGGSIFTWIGSNTINYAYQMTIVDHNMTTNFNVQVQKLKVNSQDLILSDPITVNDEFTFNGVNFTYWPNSVSNFLTFTTNHPAVNQVNLPNLLNFTNLGSISIPLQANFGLDRATNYNNIINHGLIQSGSLLFGADYFENTNTISAFNGSIFITASTNRLNGGVLSASQSINLSGDDLETTNTTLSAQRLVFNITNRLSDLDVTNRWSVNGGFGMSATPIKGDLLATEITSFAGTNLTTVQQWAGEDRGDHPAGYANNAAVAKLVLDAASGGRFFFSGNAPSVTNAMYVDTLQLNNNATNFSTAISVGSNFRLYFANLVDTNNMPLPADKFTNAHSGRVVWVSDTTRSGPMVAVTTGIGQSTNMTTRALRALLPAAADFDGDGIRNDVDITPLSGFTLNDVSRVDIADPPGSDPTSHAKITWQAVANTSYLIERRDSVADDAWTPVTVVIATADGEMSAYDPLPTTGQRFYRIRYSR